MKSPTELAIQLKNQWQKADYREQRLLNAEAWPVSLSIGKPSSTIFREETAKLREHIQQWHKLKIGTVVWETVKYKGSSEPIEIPKYWQLNTAAEWVEASNDAEISRQYQKLTTLLAQTDSRFQRLWVRKLSLWLEKPATKTIKAAQVALHLSRGYADGSPLRALAVCGVDSKFFEQQRTLLLELLKILHGAEALASGLEAFLGACEANQHWVLIVPLIPNLLPFAQLKLRTSELLTTPLPAQHILIVENENCLHQLPPLANTIAVLGAGLDLEWLQAIWLRDKQLAYWGDLDTWGLVMLARARTYQPHLTALLMTQAVFDEYATFAVAEPNPAEAQAPSGLSDTEAEFYAYLRSLAQGRLEQERLPAQLTQARIVAWHSDSRSTGR